MSLKYKIPLLLFTAFLLNVVCLYLFYHFYTVGQIENNMQDLYLQFDKMSNEIMETIKKDSDENINELLLSLNETVKDKDFNVFVFDESNQLIFKVNNSKSSGIRVASKGFFEDKLGDFYNIQIEKNIDVPNKNVTVAVNILILFGVFSLLLTLVMIFAYLNFEVSKPLIQLRNKMDNLYKPNRVKTSYIHGDEIRLLNQGFEKMSDELEKSKKSQNELIASISHDIKNPLTSIMGYAERLIESDSLGDDRKRKYHKIIHSKAGDIKTMIDEFNTYIDDENGYFKFENIELRGFVGTILEEYYEELSGMNIKFTADCDIESNCFASLDVNKMKRVFSNIISNAVKYAGENLTIYFKSIMETDVIRFFIEDNGRGVCENELDRIFDLMYRCGSERNQGKDKNGSGLGLTICKRIVEQHGGSIRAFKSDKGGLGIEFSIPLL